MSAWENAVESNEWYTPKHVFDALGMGMPRARCDTRENERE